MNEMVETITRWIETKQRAAYYALADLIEERDQLTPETVAAMSSALVRLGAEVCCGDCLTGECHWGGERSRIAQNEAYFGREYRDPESGRACDCAHHAISAHYRRAGQHHLDGWTSASTPTGQLAARQRAVYYTLAAVIEEKQHIHNPDAVQSLYTAFTFLELTLTCNDCVSGRCHWGGERSRAAQAAAEDGRDYVDPESGRACDCARHEISAHFRRSRARWRDRDMPQR